MNEWNVWHMCLYTCFIIPPSSPAAPHNTMRRIVWMLVEWLPIVHTMQPNNGVNFNRKKQLLHVFMYSRSEFENAKISKNIWMWHLVPQTKLRSTVTIVSQCGIIEPNKLFFFYHQHFSFSCIRGCMHTSSKFIYDFRLW